MDDIVGPEIPLWQRLNKTWQEAIEQRKELIRSSRLRQKKDLGSGPNQAILDLEQWFGGPIPNAEKLQQKGVDLLSEWANSGRKSNGQVSKNTRSTQENLAEGVWWLYKYKFSRSLYDLSISTSAWRRAGCSETAIEISVKEIEENQDHRPYMERVFTSHAAALCDTYRTRRDSSLLERAIDLNNRAIALSPDDPHPYMQLHRSYSLLGKVGKAVEALVLAGARQVEPESFRLTISREVKNTWEMISSETWGSEYKDSIRQAMRDNSVPFMDDLPF